MATLTVKNIPQPIVERLKQQAMLHRRSLNLEVIACLEAAVESSPVDPEALVARVRALRVRPRSVRLTDRLLTRLKDAGRP
jgi:plasmid stability protein